MVRFIHSADWQLGMTRHFLQGEAQARFTGDRLDVIGTIGQLAVEQNCSFVVVGGDVFESNQIGRQVIVRALEAMRATPTITFYLLPGNHDPLDAASIFRSATFVDNQPDNVVVLDSTEEVEVRPGVTIIGAPWPNKRPLKDLVTEAIDQLTADGTTRIVVGHGAVDTYSPDPTDPARVILADVDAALDSGTVHYVALGDRHSTTDVGTTGRVWYSGAPEATDYDEVEPGNVLVVELDGPSVSVEPHRVGKWRFVHRDFDLTGPEDVDRVAAFLDGLADKSRTIVKMALVGQLSLADMTRLEDELERASDLFGAVERWARRSELVALPDDDDFDHLGLTGFAAESLVDLQRIGSGSGDDSLVARDALALLYRLVGVQS